MPIFDKNSVEDAVVDHLLRRGMDNGLPASLHLNPTDSPIGKVILGSGQVLPLSNKKIRVGTAGLSANSVLIKPNLSGGVIYRFGSEERDSRLTMDFLLPARLGNGSSLFFESRAEYQDLYTHLWRSVEHRFDLGFGLGWRHVSDKGLMLGTNAFWDASRYYGDWYSSPGFGFEFAWHSSRGVWDLALNAYRGGGVDLEGGFTYPIWDERLDLRIYAEKYRFFDGEFILGSKVGAEISSPDRLIAVSYEYGQDSRNPEYHAISCSLTVPFRLENIFYGKNPIEAPNRPDAGNRYIERLKSEGVKRAWRQPDTVVEARRTPQGRRWTTPGKLTDSILWASKRGKPRSETADAASKEASQECSLLWSLLKEALTGSASLKAIFAAGATYVGGDYAYRNAFGPFEIEPYELERIRQEMPKRPRRR